MKIKIEICNKNPELDLMTAALTCRGKTADVGKWTKERWMKWLMAEHTPIETIQMRIEFDEMSKSVVAQLVRHTDKSPRHFVQSSRPDLNDGKPRDPNSLIKYTCYYNPQALILMMRKRLCASAEKSTRQTAALLKWKLMSSDNPLLQAVGEMCVPNCIYRCGCCEPWNLCVWFEANKQFENGNILLRYSDYNNHFTDIMENLEMCNGIKV